MANYYASCRTNYFRVKDPKKFENEFLMFRGVEACQRDGFFCLLGDCPNVSGWPSYEYNDETDEEVDIDLPALVAEHLDDEEVAIFIKRMASCSFSFYSSSMV